MVVALIETAVFGILGAGILAMIAQVFLAYLGQRNQNDILAQGMQAVVGTNTIETADQRMDDGANDGSGGN